MPLQHRHAFRYASATTRMIWAGDQLLWELRSTDANDGGNTQGQVSYFQAGGIDRPLTIWKASAPS